MNSLKHNLVPLQAASLCLDCEVITAAHGRCVACGSVALLNIARALDRPGKLQLLRDDRPPVVPIASVHAARFGDFLQST
jgi:hypothetical protein